VDTLAIILVSFNRCDLVIGIVLTSSANVFSRIKILEEADFVSGLPIQVVPLIARPILRKHHGTDVIPADKIDFKQI
jgi:hypothetical protein